MDQWDGCGANQFKTHTVRVKLAIDLKRERVSAAPFTTTRQKPDTIRRTNGMNT